MGSDAEIKMGEPQNLTEHRPSGRYGDEILRRAAGERAASISTIPGASNT